MVKPLFSASMAMALALAPALALVKGFNFNNKNYHHPSSPSLLSPPPPSLKSIPLPAKLAGGLFLFQTSVQKCDKELCREVLDAAQDVLRKDPLVNMELGSGLEAGGVFCSSSSSSSSIIQEEKNGGGTPLQQQQQQQQQQFVCEFQLNGGNSWAQCRVHAVKTIPGKKKKEDLELLYLGVANMDASLSGGWLEVAIPSKKKEEEEERIVENDVGNINYIIEKKEEKSSSLSLDAAAAAAASEQTLAKNADNEEKKDDPIAAIVGLSALGTAAGSASVAGTVATAAGGACAGGACVAGAGALASTTAAAAGTTGAATAAAAATGGGLLAGVKAFFVGSTLAAGLAFNGLSPSASSAASAPTLEAMVRASTPLELAVTNGRPSVVEFYGEKCPHCHDAARNLRSVEQKTIDRSWNWVMVNTDDPKMAPLWMAYGVDELPHFEFLDATGHEVAHEAGVIPVQAIEERIGMLDSSGL